VLNAWAMSIVLFGALTAVFGWQVLPFLLIQAAYGASLMESVNYLEHYGLLLSPLYRGDPNATRTPSCSIVTRALLVDESSANQQQAADDQHPDGKRQRQPHAQVAGDQQRHRCQIADGD
jgi:hypothetical protein